MRLQFTLTGVSPILMHNGPAGIDTRNPLSREIAAIAAKKGGDRTDVDRPPAPGARVPAVPLSRR